MSPILMPITQNFAAYRASISNELQTARDRIRNLIGDAHWQTDGEHKEHILRRIIRNHAPEIFRISRGFVCYPRSGKSSGQIDVLISPKSLPTLYHEDDLVIVTADAAKAIIEVKTKLQRGQGFEQSVRKLCDNLEQIRKHSSNEDECWGGLFIYEDARRLTDRYVLETLQHATRRRLNRVINCVSVGTDLFVRFWPHGHPKTSPEASPMWHSYRRYNLPQPYFIGNAIAHITPDISDDDIASWFTMRGTKELQRQYYAKLSETTAKKF